MDTQALFQITYGLFVVSSAYGNERSGCVVNTLTQVTNTPDRLSVAVSKENYTAGLIEKSGVFAAVVLNEDADFNLIGRFGFKSGREISKYEGNDFQNDANGIPYQTEAVSARFSCRVTQKVDVGTHFIFIGVLEEAEKMSDIRPMTYEYYRTVIKGGTPKNAPSYQMKEKTIHKENVKMKKKFRCLICGYEIEVEGDSLPEDFVCPICGVGPDQFEEVE